MRELFIKPIDKTVDNELKMYLFQHNVYGYQSGEYYPKCKGALHFYDVCMHGLEVGSQHNAYREMLKEVFGDDLPNREPYMIKSLQAKGVTTSLPILYSLIQSALYGEFGEFEC